MEGVILFADDHIFDSGRLEHKLFQKFTSDSGFSTLPINNLDTLEKTVLSISTYRALILDWNFKRKFEEFDEGVNLPDENPYEFLKSNKIYSLVYIYSQEQIAKEISDELKSLYPGKIFFEQKNSNNDPDKEFEKIIDSIKRFEIDNNHLKVPFIWSQAINQSAQIIFSELEQADPNWIKEIYNTAIKDGAEPNTEVIGVFQHLLSEQIVQNELLLSKITSLAESPDISVKNKDESLAKLYHRIYYTRVSYHAPLMTGDIFNLDENISAVLITPECDIKQKLKTGLDFLMVSKLGFSEHLSKAYSIENGGELTKNQTAKIGKLFNQEEIKIHILPSFPFESDQYKNTALIEFQSCFGKLMQGEIFDEEGNPKNRVYKLNSPFIYQLRQRYLSYVGRVGVPAIPESLRVYNLK